MARGLNDYDKLRGRRDLDLVAVGASSTFLIW